MRTLQPVAIFLPGALLCAVVLADNPSEARPSVTRADGRCFIESSVLRLELDESTGAIAVTDRRSGYVWRSARTAEASTVELRLRRAPQAPRIDARLDEWPSKPCFVLTPDMTADAAKLDGPKDVSGNVWLMWDAQHLYIGARVTDEQRLFATRADERWWERDSIEFWVNGTQVALALAPAHPVAIVQGRGAIGGAGVAVAETGDGYVVEASLPWSAFRVSARLGAQLRFALGANDADTASGREAQLYYPTTWVHSDPRSFALATLADAGGHVPPSTATDATAALRNVRVLPGGRARAPGVTFEKEATAASGQTVPVSVTVTLPEAADVVVEVDVPDRTARYADFTVFAPFVLDAENGFVIAPRYSSGVMFETDDLRWKGTRWTTYGTLDMPWVGVTDLTKGYLLLAETPDDAVVRLESAPVQGRQVLAPALYWQSAKGQFRYPRRFRLSFVDEGGHVAICKRYRAYAKQMGYFKTLRQKQREVPQVARLAGAPDFWGVPGLQFCREAKAAGIERALINGRWMRADMEAITDLGYLIGEYDNYVDIQDGPLSESNRAPLPASAIKDSGGNPVRGWVTWDKKTTFMKMCPALAVEAAQLEIDAVLRDHPYNTRFLDVTTASGLRECYDEQHPLTRTEYRQANERLAAYVKGLGLVLGGEHGRWYGVRWYDYWEGMQSGGFYSWPAGHVGTNIPQTRDDIGADYLKYGIGHYNRVPLWELCFHDCVVSTWYWGDSTGHLYTAAPEMADKKDAFNVLYGTIPLYWVSRPFSFNWQEPELRARLLQSYRTTCQLHQQLFYDEMLSHRFVTDDHAVQETRWESGIVATVNFGDEPYEVRYGGQEYILPTNGFLAAGKDFLQYKALVPGASATDRRQVTYVRAPGYVFCDPGGREYDFAAARTAVRLTVRVAGEGTLIVNIEDEGEVTIRPRELVRRWDIAAARGYLLDEEGRRMREVDLDVGKDALTLRGEAGAYALLSGRAVRRPDLAIVSGTFSVIAGNPQPSGTPLQAGARVANFGGAAARARVQLVAMTTAGPLELATAALQLDPGQERPVRFTPIVPGMDGRYRLELRVSDARGREELLTNNNAAQADVLLPADYASWAHRFAVTVHTGDAPRHDEPVTIRVDLAEQLGVAADALNLASVRVVETDAAGNLIGPVPTQFRPETGARRELCWLMPGGTPAKAQRHFLALCRQAGTPSGPQPMGELSWDDEQQAFASPVYRAVFRDGVISALHSLEGIEPRRSFLKSLGVSSEATGWVDEVGEVTSLEVLDKGPVRVVVQVRKKLRGEYEYAKTYCFYHDYFIVETDLNKPISHTSRAYYRRRCQFEDDKGNRAVVDGKGNAEDVSGKNADPRWYACYSDEWAHSCVALSPFTNITYWDAGSWGGIGFSTGATEGARLAYVIHAGQPDAGFAAADYTWLTRPVRTVVSGR